MDEEARELDKLKQKKDAIANLNIEISKNLAQNERMHEIQYYEKMALITEDMAKYAVELEMFVAVIEHTDEKNNTMLLYELYDKENNKIGNVVNGRIHFSEQYLELVKERCEDDLTLYYELLQMDGKIEFRDLLDRNKDKSFIMTEREIDEYIRDEYNKEYSPEKRENEEEREQDEEEKENMADEATLERIAKEKGIPTHSIVFVKDNSTLYKNHPELERNMYFYRDKDGVVKAEYIDENGKTNPSKFINESKSYMRQVVDIGKDGSNIEREVPYQFMTSSISSKGSNVREIGFSVELNMGYLEIKEARLGSNGEWTSHEVEMKGRDYNSQEVNEQTDLMHKSSNPDKISDNYERVEDTGFNENGIQIDELNLEEVIERLIDEGYQRSEAIDIINYMIGEEELSEEKAKERVDEEIKERRERERSLEETEERTIEDIF